MATVRKSLVLKMVTKTRAFVAFSSHYWCRTETFADVAQSLHELTRKNRAFNLRERFLSFSFHFYDLPSATIQSILVLLFAP